MDDIIDRALEVARELKPENMKTHHDVERHRTLVEVEKRQILAIKQTALYPKSENHRRADILLAFLANYMERLFYLATTPMYRVIRDIIYTRFREIRLVSSWSILRRNNLVFNKDMQEIFQGERVLMEELYWESQESDGTEHVMEILKDIFRGYFPSHGVTDEVPEPLSRSERIGFFCMTCAREIS